MELSVFSSVILRGKLSFLFIFSDCPSSPFLFIKIIYFAVWTYRICADEEEARKSNSF